MVGVIFVPGVPVPGTGVLEVLSLGENGAIPEPTGQYGAKRDGAFGERVFGSLGGVVGYGVTVGVAVGPAVGVIVGETATVGLRLPVGEGVGERLPVTEGTGVPERFAAPVGEGVGVVLFCVPTAAFTAARAFTIP